MRNWLNICSFAVVVVAGALLWFVMPSDAETMSEAAETHFPELPEGFHIDGMQGGYLIPSEPLFLGEIEVSSIIVEPPVPDCDQAAYARIFATVESDMTGWIIYEVSVLSVTSEAIEIRAVSEDAPELIVRGYFQADALSRWQSGQDAVEQLVIASVSIGETRQDDVVLNFWIGD